MSKYKKAVVAHFEKMDLKECSEAFIACCDGTPSHPDDTTIPKTVFYDMKKEFMVDYLKSLKPYESVHHFLHDYPPNQDTIRQSEAENRPIDEYMFETSLYCSQCGGKLIGGAEQVKRSLDEIQADSYTCLRRRCKNPQPRAMDA